MITGIRGLCNGLGPAVYGLIFYIFHVDLEVTGDGHIDTIGNATVHLEKQERVTFFFRFLMKG